MSEAFKPTPARARLILEFENIVANIKQHFARTNEGKEFKVELKQEDNGDVILTLPYVRFSYIHERVEIQSFIGDFFSVWPGEYEHVRSLLGTNGDVEKAIIDLCINLANVEVLSIVRSDESILKTLAEAYANKTVFDIPSFPDDPHVENVCRIIRAFYENRDFINAVTQPEKEREFDNNWVSDQKNT